MAFFKRIFLFLALNFIVVMTISIVLNLLNVRPFLSAYGLDLQSLAIFCLVWGMGGALISLGLSRIMAKWMMKIEIIDPKNHSPAFTPLVDAVRILARRAKVPLPEIGIYHSPEVNAFATGPTQSRSLVAVSTGLLNRMKPHELEGVLGHEIAHIANGDMVTMTLLQGVVNAFVMFLARALAFVFSGMGRSRENNSSGSYGSFMLFTYLFEIVFMILGSIGIAAYSRFREFRADGGGAKLAGKDSMIGALEALKSFQNIKEPQESPAMAAFKISHSGKKGILSLFATHPPLEERIARLQKGRT